MGKLIRDALKQGWTEVTNRGGGFRHHKLRCPCGLHQIVVSASASENRAIHNARSTFRKCPTWVD